MYRAGTPSCIRTSACVWGRAHVPLMPIDKKTDRLKSSKILIFRFSIITNLRKTVFRQKSKVPKKTYAAKRLVRNFCGVEFCGTFQKSFRGTGKTNPRWRRKAGQDCLESAQNFLIQEKGCGFWIWLIEGHLGPFLRFSRLARLSFFGNVAQKIVQAGCRRETQKSAFQKRIRVRMCPIEDPLSKIIF